MLRNKVLLLGGSGFLGLKILELVPSKYDIYPTYFSKNNQSNNWIHLDLFDLEEVKKVIKNIKPNIILCPARFNPYENNLEKISIMMNNLVDLCNINSIKLLFISSDAVFDGKMGNYKEGDEANPLSDYGKSKLLAENIIKEKLDNYVIIRTSYIYGHNQNGHDDKTSDLIRANKNNGVICRAENMYKTPVDVESLAKACWKLIDNDFRGIIHVAGEKESVFEFSKRRSREVNIGDSNIVSKDINIYDSNITPDTSLNTDLFKEIL